MSQEIIAQERARIRQVSNAPGAKEFPKLCDALCDSDESAEKCIAIIAAALDDRQAAQAARPAAAAWPKDEPKAGVGIGTPEPIGRAPAAEGWNRAVANVNRHIGEDAAGGTAAAGGWKRAVGAAGR
ncbi:hypothetical protein NKI34_10440 [Mesorhizobium sp. M0700]|uniref:hypothetical protein n=1 Tax=Mesorhizobium sp. M0700 TaxID=2956988 RepID=UPI0033360C9E